MTIDRSKLITATARIAEARQHAISKIAAWRNAEEQREVVFEHAGRRWDGGIASRDRITLSVAMARAGELPTAFFWTDADNNDITGLGLEELEALREAMLVAIATHGFRIHERQRSMKAAVEAMDSVQLREFSPGWDDKL